MEEGLLNINDDESRILETYYTDLSYPTAFRGKTKLKNTLKDRISQNKVDQWLRGKDYYTLFKRAKQHFPRRPTIVSGPEVTLQADLMDMSNYSATNDGVKFLLNCIDVMTRFVWVIPIKNKSGAQVASALSDVIKDKKYMYIQTDKGREFYNPQVSKLLKEHGIKHYSSEDDRIKSSMVERFNQTLRVSLHRFMTYRRKKRYIDVLQSVVDTYNNSPHGRDKLVPVNAKSMNSEDIWLNRYEHKQSDHKKSPSFKIGDYVRVSAYRGAFARGYDEFWTREVFRITAVLTDENPIVYNIEDLMGEDIKGTYYEDELQLIDYDPEGTFEIEKILARRRRNGVKEVLVKWMGYGDKFNNWIPESNVVPPQ